MSLIDTYFTDEIDIVSVSQDGYGALTETVTEGVMARIEYKNQLIKDINGREVNSQANVLVGGTATIQYQDFIKLKKVSGSAIQEADKKMGIKMLSRPHGWPETYWKVYL